MKTRREEAFGVVLIAKGKVLLVNNADFPEKGSWWGFPKGHREGTETNMEAALRELKEETGVELQGVNDQEVIIENYSYAHPDGTRVDKTNHYFVIEVDECIDTVPDGNEIIETQWVADIEIYLKSNTLKRAVNPYIKGVK